MAIDPVIAKIIKRCQKDPAFFINNFCKVKHPKLGIIPFTLFKYQRRCLQDFLKNRFNVFRKCRQVGISTLTGAFALWYAMFFSHKTVLIVSKRDDDAKDYLTKNIKFVYSHLPDWMKSIWQTETFNEHTIGFTNGSTIRSLTSSPDTLRSQSGSLNIIDEAAFIDKMDIMWRGGWSTLQHGGSAIVISTPKGVGNWYYKTWVGAVNKENDFNPILINWWDMDWKLEYVDELSKNKIVIAPTNGLRKIVDQKELEKYGPYWSPWLEGEYRQLATKGDDSSFRQEVLAEFIGSGDTVLNRNALFAVEQTVENEELEEFDDDALGFISIDRIDYINPQTGDSEVLDFHDTFHVWKKPYTKADAEEAVREARLSGDLGSGSADFKPHSYIIGADPSTGEADDFCTIQVLDLDTREQVAEVKIRTLPKTFAKMIDYIGRMFNNAFVVCERTGIGAAVCQELDYDLMYPNLYRHKKVAASLKIRYSQIGYPTSHSTKAVLVKHLVDSIGEDGWLIRSSRLYNELCIFIHLGGGRYGNEPGTGNTDDLVLSLTFALVGVDEAIRKGNQLLAPIHSTDVASDVFDIKTVISKHKEFVQKGGKHVIAPIGITSEVYTGKPNAAQDIAKFTAQLGGVSLSKDKKAPKRDPVSFKKHILRYFR